MNIAIIGSGNLANQMGTALIKAGHKITRVYGRNIEKVYQLALKFDADYTTDLWSKARNTEAYLILVNDDAIKEVASKLNADNSLLIHASGSTDIDVLSDFSENFGVIYPFFTFSSQPSIDWKKIPICFEANNLESAEKLDNLANTLSDQVYFMDFEKRKKLHLAGVFACNFTNYLYRIAEELVAKSGLSIEILKPIILETALKIQQTSAAKVQTGPAIRGDLETIQKHLDILDNDKDFREIYKLMSEGIMQKYEQIG